MVRIYVLEVDYYCINIVIRLYSICFLFVLALKKITQQPYASQEKI